jgi:hypothetical protein
MKVRLGRASALAALCTGAAFAASVPVASAAGTKTCSTITGAGSSLQNVAQNEVWIKGAEAFGSTGIRWEKSECKEDPSITYFPTSSGKGLAQWGSSSEVLKEENPPVTKFPAYIGTDVGPEGPSGTAGTQMHDMDVAGKSSTTNNEVVTVPVAQSAIAVIVSLPEGCTATEGDTPKVKSTKLEEEWLKDEIQLGTLITGAGIVCAKVPHLYARESPSGTTAGFKRWNDDINPTNAEWKALTATAAEAESTNWPKTLPSGQPEEKGHNKGIEEAEAVFTTPGTTGAVGYADATDAIKAGFTTKVEKHGHAYASFMVEVQHNKVSEETATYASPLSGEGSNCATAEYEKAPATVGPNVDWSVAKQFPVEGITGYPICTLTFDVAWHEYELPKKESKGVYTEGEGNSVLNYLKYIVKSEATEGGQNTQLTGHHYGKLPTPIREKAETGVTSANIKP